ncbi:MAG: 1,4-alpha-glucan branching enzyme [Sphingobacteriia bacterium 24-36-13]|jgi:1,4-alpha-glucan branching enzyme|uniref:1,4-alpha-glucan branching protein GlgB n=1 Tax=Sediminibacterium sp. TaxID=1917865 RepID=UPI000BDB7EB0|nr:1,4-alpha-glucan branching protein GlgB [Sediminibacterium sp.]OYY11021.1 MAG: 1,4-alpha-glucan branching enzyme [Sphingobacteriia bacterium 35-36-14]OYZ54418.1 MAG: 1,4-alpha-glucan branching enzyme [Sphingobacteriia bacterium 24-36-13]OZA65193.1 MAG: 1,4-alpha-glucan branching enzyme [Sphingobacteriia bacterium 39-36-14]HQS24276.1 1,4-alpha-glucan branching protein GlgB [Sediminibacterium sp.]HQS34632.1 1,4-alpha-glucan branching protein GlgB [Sediminibacterium sp.]
MSGVTSRNKKTIKVVKAQEKKYEDIHFVDTQQAVWNYSLFTEEAVRNFQNGTHYSLYEYFGNKQIEVLETKGTYFAVWAPNATYISVTGYFNNWDKTSHPLKVRLDNSGIWEGFIPNVLEGEAYKYHIHGFNGIKLDKGDPFAHFWEKRPFTASITWQTNYEWKDQEWMKNRKTKNSLKSPYSVYEVHLASWMRPDKNDEESYNTYEQIAERMVPYVKEMGFTHVEFMPVMEHPFDGSWGYQGTGYFAPTSRFGSPQGYAYLVDAFHQAGIGVILDWVPSHFPYDAHGLFMFDGTHTYEYADMRKGYHPDWNSYIFNYKRGEVKSFLISSARFWCDQFHTDGIRVDAVSSMLRLDYSRGQGQWEPNEYGGNGNLEAIDFIRDLNETLYRDFPDIQTIAEEATDWPKISKPTFEGGLGFGMKWMMGWMHDTLDYYKMDPIFRQFHQDKFSFSMMYYYDENFMLPLSHDEVVHGKSPMLYKMPGDEWQKFANLRILYTYMFTHPGAKLLFMGNEFGATNEWNYKSELQWDLLQHPSHGGMKYCVQQLNKLYQSEPALYEKQFEPGGFEWVDLNHRSDSVMVYKRKGKKEKDDVIVILNVTPVVRHDWEIYLHGKGKWAEIFNSDSKEFWGTGDVYNPTIQSKLVDKASKCYQLKVHLPALGAVVLR